jgi:uncharacterized membrane protein YdfJ with MMPL/SSD domain
MKKGWKSYLLWEGIPLLMPLCAFILIFAVNRDYEIKLISPNRGVTDWSGIYMGPILLATASGFAIAGGLLLFAVRLSQSKPNTDLLMMIPLTFVTVFLTFPSLFIIIMGPAMITMMEQMRSARG